MFSQNGEHSISAVIFRRIGVETKPCCEFGAWDGIHVSNCRNLMLEGWQALMIESSRAKARLLVETDRDNPAGRHLCEPARRCGRTES